MITLREGQTRCSGRTYAQLNGDREKVESRGLRNLLAAGNAGEVDEAWLDKALLALHGFQNLFGEAVGWKSV